MNQKAGFDLAGGAKCQFYVRPMHRIARLESDDPAPAQPDELRAQLRCCKQKRAEIVMAQQLQTFYASTHVPAISSAQQIIDNGMTGTGGCEHSLCFSY